MKLPFKPKNVYKLHEINKNGELEFVILAVERRLNHLFRGFKIGGEL